MKLWRLLMQMLPELLAEGRKVLIFSQFAKLLKMLRIRLEEQETPYLYLDGQTRRRQELDPVSRRRTTHKHCLRLASEAGLGWRARYSKAPAIHTRLQEVGALRARGSCSLPSTIGIERETNSVKRAKTSKMGPMILLKR